MNASNWPTDTELPPLSLDFYACPSNTLFQDPNPLVWLLVLYVSAQAMVLLLQDFLGPNFFLPRSLRPGGPVWEWHPLRKDTAENLEAAQDPESQVQGFGDCAICLAPILTNEEIRRRRRMEGKERDDDAGSGSSRRRRTRKHKGGGSKGNWTLLENQSDSSSQSENEDDINSKVDPIDSAPKSSLWSLDSISRLSSDIYFKGRMAGTAFRDRIEDRGLGGGMSGNGKRMREIMIAPCNHKFHSNCLEQWLAIKSECPSCRANLPPI